MAERERFGRLDRRSLAIAIPRALAFGAGTFAVLYTFCYIVAKPVMRDLQGGRYLPAVWALGVFGAVVGGLVGWAALRGSRRVVAEGRASELKPGTRGLAIARANAASGGGSRLAKPVLVQRWTPDLLVGGDLVSDPGEVS